MEYTKDEPPDETETLYTIFYQYGKEWIITRLDYLYSGKSPIYTIHCEETDSFYKRHNYADPDQYRIPCLTGRETVAQVEDMITNLKY